MFDDNYEPRIGPGPFVRSTNKPTYTESMRMWTKIKITGICKNSLQGTVSGRRKEENRPFI